MSCKNENKSKETVGARTSYRRQNKQAQKIMFPVSLSVYGTLGLGHAGKKCSSRNAAAQSTVTQPESLPRDDKGRRNYQFY